MVTSFSINMLNMYARYQAYQLPFSGGFLEQPNAYQQAMLVIENYLMEQSKNGKR